MPLDPRLTPSVLARLKALPRAAWDKMDPRLRAALLVALGAGGGVVVRDRVIPRDPPPVAAYPVTSATWASDWDMHRLQPQTVGVAFTATGPMTGMGGMIALADYGGAPHVGYTIRDCSFKTAPGAKRKWDLRVYDAIGWTIERSTFSGWHDEHAIYASAPSSFTVQECTFGDTNPATIDHSGAAIQMVFRKDSQYPHESGDATLVLAKGTQIIRRCEINYMGHQDSPRFPAFSLSLHHAQVDWDGLKTGRINSDVLIEDCTLRGGHLSPPVGTKWFGVDSPMGVMVQDRPSLTMRRVRVEYPKPANGWAGQIWFVDDVLIEECHFEGGNVEIRGAKKVTLRNCTGNANVTIGEGAFAQFPMPVKHYGGKITDDVAWAAPVVKN